MNERDLVDWYVAKGDKFKPQDRAAIKYMFERLARMESSLILSLASVALGAFILGAAVAIVVI